MSGRQAVSSAAVVVWAAALATAAAAVWGRQQAELERLVEKIARGEQAEARAAGEELIARIIDPVAAALGSLESRPAREQRRLRAVLARLGARLRVRLFRADLGLVERGLLDRFAARYPALVEQLFDDDYRKRLAGVRRIPLEPDSGAGVLVVGKVNDADGEVAAAALEAAQRLKDAVVVRGLARYVREATAAVKAGHYGPGEEEAALVVGRFVERAVRILGDAGAREALPEMLGALEYFGQNYPSDFFDVAAAARALGQIGDERAAPTLLLFLDLGRPYRFRAGKAGQGAMQTVGDAVLLSLLRIYDLDPRQVGFVVAEPPSEFAGFASQAARVAAQRRFRRWYEENAGKPPGARRAPGTQPGGGK